MEDKNFQLYSRDPFTNDYTHKNQIEKENENFSQNTLSINCETLISSLR